MARDTNAFSRAADALLEAAQATRERASRLSLLFRVARIYDTELKDPIRAESAYQRILEIDPGDLTAARGLETQKRAAGDHEGLVGLLLDRIERETEPDARKALLHEVAALYDKQLRDSENALVAFTQALLCDPRDADSIRNVERLAGSSDARWNEVLASLNQWAQESQATLLTDDDAQREAARAAFDQAEAMVSAIETELAARLAARGQELSASHAQARQRLEIAEQALTQAQSRALEVETQLETSAQRVGQLTETAELHQRTAEDARAQAEAHVEAFEELQQQGGDQPSDEQQRELDRIAAEAESLVGAAEAAEQAAEAASTEVEEARSALLEIQEALEAAQGDEAMAQQALEDEREAAAQEGAGEPQPTPEEKAQLAEAERSLEAARATLAALERRGEDEAEAQRAHELASLTEAYVLMGRWYGERLGRPDFGLSCFSQALAVDARHDGAYDGIIDMYRSSQSWPELVGVLLQRADHTKSPVKARDYRAEAAVVTATKLNDPQQARVQLERVLGGDPHHPQAQRALADIVREQQDWPALAGVLEGRAESSKGRERVDALLGLGELYEERLNEPEKAAIKYRAALEDVPRELSAWKGLERIYSLTEQYDGLIESLRAQVDLAATPKQRIALLERIGLILEEEFLDHAQSAQCFEDVIAIDAGHEGANTALERLYRHLSRFEELVETLDRHAAIVGEDQRKVELMLQAARVFAIDIGAPQRAIEMYEEVLAIDEQQQEALSELARLRTSAGDVAAAVAAVERLAEQEQDPGREAQLWIRAGKLLQDSKDRDRAIVAFKRALDLDQHASDAAEALREIYRQRGDARGAVEMLMHAIEIADGDLKRASLLAELGALYHHQLEDAEQAAAAFAQAFELDPTNTVAAAGLGSLAFAEQRFADAIEHFQQIEGRLDELPRDRAAELCAEAAEAYKALSQPDKAVAALKRARDLLPDDLKTAERYAEILSETGDPAAAERLYEKLLDQFSGQLDATERIRLLLASGEAQLGAKRGKRALETFNRVLEQKPDDPAALDGTHARPRAGRQLERGDQPAPAALAQGAGQRAGLRADGQDRRRVPGEDPGPRGCLPDLRDGARRAARQPQPADQTDGGLL